MPKKTKKIVKSSAEKAATDSPRKTRIRENLKTSKEDPNMVYLEKFCKDLITKEFSEYKRGTSMIEDGFSSKLMNLETGLSSLVEKYDILEKRILDKIDSLFQEQGNSLKDLSSGLQHEKSKRHELIKKVQEVLTQHNASIASQSKDIQNSIIVAISKDIDEQRSEIRRIRDTIDELLLKKYGFVPTIKNSSENLSMSFNQGIEAGYALDCLKERMDKVELLVRSEDDGGKSFRIEKLTMGRLENKISSIASQSRDCVTEINRLKGVVVEMQQQGGAPRRPVEDLFLTTLPSNSEEIRTLHKRMKKLAENTTKACRSLSAGLTEMQQATLNLYSWSDQVHDAMATVSDRLQYPVNICPRAKVFNPHENKNFTLYKASS